MTTEVAFLRAINVGGHATITMATLKRLFESAGCANVRTFIQSGNVLFECASSASAAVHRRTEKQLAAYLRAEVVVAYRTTVQMERTLAAAPFKSTATDSDVKLYVGFLAAKPKKAPGLPLVSPKDGLEIVGATQGEVYVVSRPIKGRYGFPNILIEKEYGVPATTRNWNTVTRIAALAAQR